MRSLNGRWSALPHGPAEPSVDSSDRRALQKQTISAARRGNARAAERTIDLSETLATECDDGGLPLECGVAAEEVGPPYRTA